MASEVIKLFVYGTLKKGEVNEPFMEECKCRFIGKAVTVHKYPLFIATTFHIPFMLNLKGTGNV